MSQVETYKAAAENVNQAQSSALQPKMIEDLIEITVKKNIELITSLLTTMTQQLNTPELAACDKDISFSRMEEHKTCYPTPNEEPTAGNVSYLLDYVEAARALRISERQLSKMVNDGTLIEGYHYQRFYSSVRFPADIAKRFFTARPPESEYVHSTQANTSETVDTTQENLNHDYANSNNAHQSVINLDY